MKAVATQDNEQSTAAEDALGRAVDTTPAFIQTARPDGYLDYFNRGWLDFLGKSLEDVCGWRWTESVHPEDVAWIVQKWHAALASGEPFEAEARVRRADGTYRALLHRKAPLHDEHGNIVKWFGSSTDIEDRKRAQEAERRRESELIEAIPAMAWSASPDSSCTYVNKNWTKYTGLSLEETVGSGWLGAVHQQDAEQHLSSWQKSVATGQPFQNEVRFRRAADGQYR